LESEKLTNEISLLKEDLAKERENGAKQLLLYEEQLSEKEEQIQQLNASISFLNDEIKSLQISSLVKETSKMHFNLANHFLKNKEYSLAISEYKRALELTPDDFDANYNLALIYDIYSDDPFLSLEYYRKCLEINPDFADREIVQERIINLSLHDAVSIGDTVAIEDDGHKLYLKSIKYKE
jgi:tetratricopeptide (TPR) repeat protein